MDATGESGRASGRGLPARIARRIAVDAVRVSRHPRTRLFIACAMLAAGIDDFCEQVLGVSPLGLDVHHGVILWSLVHLASALGETLDEVAPVIGGDGA